ncbi:uncharacterized protein PpBr36_10938 [Pyricularia pennisetigena]|uniref:uncharacterized protein n=1 Tax=Pyricularia pennisetigena TaxID=1578925 RepID=UPI00114FBDFF|nr:uncharacterized protein PpBr36_11476 [Pyricularia pennisetigena]XP_029743565.1 uncharacterized protein PpBr36_10938 [Pyricularia pennisetigena]TLS20249.1 hypothetical protein PpBr36_11476 [Pyricularia pennisetigena]TLS20715.1 hypothetical protein PpBr36_10938 [Pyricularia pennisetigena]
MDGYVPDCISQHDKRGCSKPVGREVTRNSKQCRTISPMSLVKSQQTRSEFWTMLEIILLGIYIVGFKWKFSATAHSNAGEVAQWIKCLWVTQKVPTAFVLLFDGCIASPSTLPRFFGRCFKKKTKT